jgi:hypothetical protein
VPLFAAKVAEADVRAAMLRIARGEATLSGEASRLGYAKNGHRALGNRIKAIQKREAAALEASADRQGREKVYRDRLRRARAKGHVPHMDRPEERGGQNFSAEVDAVRAQLGDEHAERLRAQARVDEAQAAAERADRRARFGFAPGGGRTYSDPEAQWVQERDDAKVAALQYAAEHPEVAQAHVFLDWGDRQIARSPAGLTDDELAAKALRYSAVHGPVEIRPLP